ncbi:MAG: cytochrome c biogenesis protein CcdA [Candidatus Kapabacteria bacterium]|nr:cytochrome c biogenesis protein CcdA [Candidatus Kapabacteria bacterium]
MIESIFTFLSELLYQNIWLALVSSFAWGILSILLSPCHLSSIPLIIGFLSSQEGLTLKKSIQLSLIFAIGILITIALIGGITLAMGRLMGDVGSVGNYIVAAVFFVVGLYLLEVIVLPWDGAKIKGTKKTGYISAFILGLIFGIGLGPCTFAFMAPILAIVFQVATTDTFYAAGLLSSFSFGHIIPIVIAGSAINLVQRYLNWSESSKATKILKKVCGVLVIFGGIYLIYTTF